MVFFTRKGDTGTSRLFSQPTKDRISKGSSVFEALGTLDELNSFLGLCKVMSIKSKHRLGTTGPSFEFLIHEIQEALFSIQAEIAGSDKTITPDKLGKLEHDISYIESVLPPITTFFISGGTELASILDVARTITRRAERVLVRALDDGDCAVSEWTLSYMNRLSSMFYAMARLSNHLDGITEEAPKYN